MAERIQPRLRDVNIIDYSDLFGFLKVLFGVAERYGFPQSHTGVHAGENETAMILALRPDLVDGERAEAGYVGDQLKVVDRIIRESMKAIASNGLLGDPAGAKNEIGEACAMVMTESVVNYGSEAKG